MNFTKKIHRNRIYLENKQNMELTLPSALIVTSDILKVTFGFAVPMKTDVSSQAPICVSKRTDLNWWIIVVLLILNWNRQRAQCSLIKQPTCIQEREQRTRQGKKETADMKQTQWCSPANRSDQEPCYCHSLLSHSQRMHVQAGSKCTGVTRISKQALVYCLAVTVEQKVVYKKWSNATKHLKKNKATHSGTKDYFFLHSYKSIAMTIKVKINYLSVLNTENPTNSLQKACPKQLYSTWSAKCWGLQQMRRIKKKAAASQSTRSRMW